MEINLIPNANIIFSQATLKLSSLDFQAYCHGNAVLLNPNLASSWNDLGVAFHQGAEFSNLPRTIQKLIPSTGFERSLERRSREGLAVYCYSKALSINGTYRVAWYNIGSDFHRGYSRFFACEAFIKKLKLQLGNDCTTLDLAEYCLLQARHYDTDTDSVMKDSIDSKLTKITDSKHKKRAAPDFTDETVETSSSPAKKPRVEDKSVSGSRNRLSMPSALFTPNRISPPESPISSPLIRGMYLVGHFSAVANTPRDFAVDDIEMRDSSYEFVS